MADEPVSMIDVSLRTTIIDLMLGLKRELQLTYLFITHDLAVAKYISDRIAIMYLGRIVEMGEKEEIFSNPLHPYTQALLSAIPVPNPERKRKIIELKGFHGFHQHAITSILALEHAVEGDLGN